MSFFLAPILAFVSPKLYREFAQKGAGRVFGYLTYLSLIWTLLFMAVAAAQYYPELAKIGTWLDANLPDIVWSEKRLEAKGQLPRTMNHPAYGDVITFDTRAEGIPQGALKGEALFFTSTKVYVQMQKGQVRPYPVPKPPSVLAGRNGILVIDKAWRARFAKNFGPLTFMITMQTVFIVFWVIVLTLAVLVSLLGLLANIFREPQLGYGGILSATLLAVTPFLLFLIADIADHSWAIPGGGYAAILFFYFVFGVLSLKPPKTEAKKK